MKTSAILFLAVFLSGLNSQAQNRIHGWDIDKISSITVELTSPANETNILVFNSRQDIESIMTFLKNVEFRELNGSSLDPEDQKSNWKSKIVFHGQRDQVYLYKNSASIGKTSFLIDHDVIDEFRTILEQIQQDK